MEERGPGRVLVALHGGDRRGSPPGRAPPEGDGGGEDRLSDLPDDLLLNIIGGLDSTDEAARTSALARRWRRPLWPELHALVFRGLDSDTVRGLLAVARCRNLSRLEIRVPRPRQAGEAVAAPQVTSLLRAAEEHQPKEFVLEIGGGARDDVPIELPRFTRATSIDLKIWNRGFTMPPAGDLFSCLNRLTLSLCTVLPEDFLPYCPQLQVLNMSCYWVFHTVTISSGSLEELFLRHVPGPVEEDTPQILFIEGPVLKKFRQQSIGNRGVITYFSAPMLDMLSFMYCSRASRCIGFNWPRRWRVLSLSTAMEWITWYWEDEPVCVRVLSMVINNDNSGYSAASRSFTEEMQHLPVNNFSVLKLEIRTEGQTFAPIALDLLETLNAIQRLQLVLPPSNNESCSQIRDVIRDAFKTDQHIFLGELEEVEIEGLNLTYDDLKFLKLLFASASELKTVKITLLAGLPQSNNEGYKELYSIFSENPSVKCSMSGRLD